MFLQSHGHIISLHKVCAVGGLKLPHLFSSLLQSFFSLSFHIYRKDNTFFIQVTQTELSEQKHLKPARGISSSLSDNS